MARHPSARVTFKDKGQHSIKSKLPFWCRSIKFEVEVSLSLAALQLTAREAQGEQQSADHCPSFADLTSKSCTHHLSVLKMSHHFFAFHPKLKRCLYPKTFLRFCNFKRTFCEVLVRYSVPKTCRAKERTGLRMNPKTETNNVTE